MLHGIFIYDKMDCIDMYTKYQMIYISIDMYID